MTDNRDVYFIQAGSDRVKIGLATDVGMRFAALQNGSPIPLRLVAIEPGGGRDRERVLHGRYARDRLHGEWFRLSPELQYHIAAHAHHVPVLQPVTQLAASESPDSVPPQPREEMTPRLYTVDEFAGMLGHSPDWVERRVRSREFPCVRAGRSIRFTDAQVEQILAKYTVEAADRAAPTGLTPRAQRSYERRRRQAS